MRYKTFLRAARNFNEFSSARKKTVDRGLTLEEARRACATFNNARSPAQIKRGIKLEFTQDD